MPTVRYTVIDGEVIAEKRSGVRKEYVPDPLGSTVALLDSTQTVTDSFSYWPYGEEQARTGTTTTPFEFVGTIGYYKDSSSKTYVRARYLDVKAGRWMSSDPSHLERNQYVYGKSSPISLTDASGLQAVPFDPQRPVPECSKDACKACRKDIPKSFGGVTACENGKLCYCVFYDGPSDCVKKCAAAHEKAHIRQGGTDPCAEDGVYVPILRDTGVECIAMIVSQICLANCCPTEKKGKAKDDCERFRKANCRAMRNACAGQTLPLPEITLCSPEPGPIFGPSSP